MPNKMRIFDKCAKVILCDGCDKLVNQNKKFPANLNELKQQELNEFGHMLPKYITT